MPADDVKETLDRLEASVVELKRQYDLFFQGGRRSEPVEERRALETHVRRMGQRRLVNTADQFRFNAIQGRFFALQNLWARTVRDLEEGRLVRDAGGTARRALGQQDTVEESHLDAVMERLREARAACGLSAGEEELAAIRETLRERAREIARLSGRRVVEFRVTVEEGKPRIKALTR